jgi:hypothetical protein
MTKNASLPRKSAALRSWPETPSPDSWSVPCGLTLAEFGLRGGFLLPPLLGPAASGRGEMAVLARVAEVR